MWMVRIQDISSRGMQLSADEPVGIRGDIKVRWNGRDINGTIQYNHKYDPTPIGSAWNCTLPPIP